jgi:hypothetical protein
LKVIKVIHLLFKESLKAVWLRNYCACNVLILVQA